MTAWLGFSSGRPSPKSIAIWLSCLLSKRRTLATLSTANSNGSGAGVHFFFCPTLSAKLWPFSLASGAGGSAVAVVVSVESLSGVRLRGDIVLILLDCYEGKSLTLITD